VIGEVEALMREVAEIAILPRFGKLTPEEITEKGPGDLVTAADHEAEELLGRALTELLPGSLVVGEEAVAADRSRLSMVASDGPVWVIDPVDGTSNFAAGVEPFAVMVALLRSGSTVASWILDPVNGIAAVAERGGGSYLDGVRVWAPSQGRPAEQLRGPSFARYMPRVVRQHVERASGTVGAVLPGHNCAGYEYPALVRDEQQFVVFWRTLPWDHAPGTLFVEEAGGVARWLDGTPYSPAADRFGLLVAQNPDVWQTVRDSLLRDTA
jgi:fructose-1,6-bisphosphatase/inositol monophosphatase family enzyme